MGATPHQSGHLFVVERTQFRHIDQQAKGSGLANTGYADEDIEACLQVFVGNYPGHQFVFKRLQDERLFV